MNINVWITLLLPLLKGSARIEGLTAWPNEMGFYAVISDMSGA